MIYADLHVHTAYSDGLHTIEDVVRIAKDSGLKALAITDHDTVFHWEEVRRLTEAAGLEAVRGVEMSCYDPDVYKKVHIVGLWLNDDASHVDALCRETLRCRDAYHHKMVELLKEKGLDITYEEAKKFAPYNIVFKMHLYMAIVQKYPAYKDPMKYRELFAGKTTRETDAQMGYIDIQEGIRAILKDGGIPVLAHPCEYDNYDEVEKYVGYGLKGIEISHPSMKEEDYPRTQALAEKYHLLCSGGSDFHLARMKKLGTMGIHGLTEGQFRDIKKGATV